MNSTSTFKYSTSSNYGLATGGGLSENFVSPYSKSSIYQERTIVQGSGPGNLLAINSLNSQSNLDQHKDPKNYEDFQKILEQGQLIDGMTG